MDPNNNLNQDPTQANINGNPPDLNQNNQPATNTTPVVGEQPPQFTIPADSSEPLQPFPSMDQNNMATTITDAQALPVSGAGTFPATEPLVMNPQVQPTPQTPEFQSAPLPTPTIQSPPKKGMSVMNIALIFLIIVLLLVMGYVAYAKLTTVTTSNPNPTPVVEFIPSPEPTVEEAPQATPAEEGAQPTEQPASDSPDLIPTVSASPSTTP